MDLRRDQLKNTVRSHRGLIVLVFHADWCASCRTLAPVLQELEKEKKHVLFAKIDVDAEVALAMDFGITSIPTLIFLKDGVPAGQMIGLHPKEDILRMIEENESYAAGRPKGAPLFYSNLFLHSSHPYSASTSGSTPTTSSP